MTRSRKFWVAVTIVVTLAIAAWAWGQLVYTQHVGATPRVTSQYKHVRIERTTTQPTRIVAGRVVTKSRSEETGDCIVQRFTNEKLVCLWQRVDWSWRYNFDLHRASWVDVDWDKWTTRDSMLSNWWHFKQWDGSVTKHGEYPSAGENLQWKERRIWATFEYCIPLGPCTDTRQNTVAQHIENYGDGGYKGAALG